MHSERPRNILTKFFNLVHAIDFASHRVHRYIDRHRETKISLFVEFFSIISNNKDILFIFEKQINF